MPPGDECANFLEKHVIRRRRRSKTFREIFPKPLDKTDAMVYNIRVRGYSLMVKLQLPKLAMRVRFPLLAPLKKDGLGSSFFSGANDRRKKTPKLHNDLRLFGVPTGDLLLGRSRNATDIPRFRDLLTYTLFYLLKSGSFSKIPELGPPIIIEAGHIVGIIQGQENTISLVNQTKPLIGTISQPQLIAIFLIFRQL